MTSNNSHLPRGWCRSVQFRKATDISYVHMTICSSRTYASHNFVDVSLELLHTESLAPSVDSKQLFSISATIKTTPAAQGIAS